jgi:hypothetical protein
VAATKNRHHSGSFKKGNPGRPKGTPNVLTRTVKEAVLDAFNELRGDRKANLVAWGKKNPGAFYQVAARLIPTEIKGGFDKIKLEIVRTNDTGQTEETAP